MENFKLLKNNPTAFRTKIKTLTNNNILNEKYKIYENYDSLNLLEYGISLGDLTSVKSMIQRLETLGITFNNYDKSYNILETTLKLLEFTTFETLKEVKEDESWDDIDADEWENGEIEETEKSLQFDAILKILDYFLQKGIMKNLEILI